MGDERKQDGWQQPGPKAGAQAQMCTFHHMMSHQSAALGLHVR